MTSSCAISRWGPEGARCKHPWASISSENCVWLGNGIFWTHGHACIGTHAVGPLQESVHEIPDGPIYVGKTTFLESKRQLSSVFWTFLGSPWTCLGNSKLDPPKKGCEVDFGRRGKLTCHRIDELFKPNCRTRPPK